jgi:DNA-binding LacI/PurR family transcriptional regulator
VWRAADDTGSTWLYPGLTTTREFPEQLGQQMVKLVLNRIAQPNLAPQVVTIPTELIKRESCKPLLAAKEPLPAEVAAG